MPIANSNQSAGNRVFVVDDDRIVVALLNLGFRDRLFHAQFETVILPKAQRRYAGIENNAGPGPDEIVAVDPFRDRLTVNEQTESLRGLVDQQLELATYQVVQSGDLNCPQRMRTGIADISLQVERITATTQNVTVVVIPADVAAVNGHLEFDASLDRLDIKLQAG